MKYLTLLSLLVAHQQPPRNLAVVPAVMGPNVVIRFGYTISGADSVLTRNTSPAESHRRLATGSAAVADSFVQPRPTTGTIGGSVCVQTKKAAKLSAEKCTPWNYTEPVTAPPDPVITGVTVDTTGNAPSNAPLLSVNFDDGLLHGIGPWSSGPAGKAPPAIVTDTTATGGKSLQQTWVGGVDNNSGALIYLPTGTQAVSVRFRYKVPPTANQSGIMKLVRFRGPGDRAIGTIDVFGNQWLHWGDDMGDGQNHYGSGSTPADCKGKWCWVETSIDYTTGTSYRARLWINGTLVLDYTRTGINWTQGIAVIYLWSYFNTPADSRSEWIDEVSVSVP